MIHTVNMGLREWHTVIVIDIPLVIFMNMITGVSNIFNNAHKYLKEVLTKTVSIHPLLF